MVIGVPRGYFYYDYYGFIKRLFDMDDEKKADIELISGEENDDETLMCGSRLVVDEACLPIKLTAGQAERMSRECDWIFIPRIMKDFRGRWLCPKLLGLPELLSQISAPEKLLITEPIFFDNKSEARRVLWKVCSRAGMGRRNFLKNFEAAYEYQKGIAGGTRTMHVEAAWEFTPEAAEDEIILPNVGKVLLIGHCYNVYDKFSNGNVMDKLDMLGLEAVTERSVLQSDKEKAVSTLGLIKTPFWESLVRMLGTAIILKDHVEGIIYLSSFSCGPDAFIIDMIKTYLADTPMMVIKLDEHKGTAGFETRLEAFADLLQRRRAS